MTRRRICQFVPILLGFTVLLAVSEARAQGEESEPDADEAEFTQGSTVRHKLLYRSTRFEVAPLFGMTLGDAYLHNGVAGLNLAYYMTNEIGIGLNAGYGAIHPDTSLGSNMKARLDENDPEALEGLTLSYLQWMAGIEFLYVPVFGKLSILNSVISHYDLHLIGGFTMIGRSACEADACPKSGSNPDSNLSGIAPAGTIGLGVRFFVADAYAVNLQIRDHLYERAEISSGDADPTFSSNVFLSLGFSFFLPQEVKISR